MRTEWRSGRWVVLGVLVLAAGAARGQKSVAVPAHEILSGKALNEVLTRIIGLGYVPLPEPEPPLPRDVRGKISLVTPAGVDASVFLRADSLTWPTALVEISPECQRLRTLLASVGREAAKGPLSGKNRKELKNSSAALLKRLNDQVADVTPTDYILARRWLNRVERALASAGRQKLGDELALAEKTAGAKTMDELVARMKQMRLQFAEALPGEEASNLKLYRTLLDYHAKLRRARGK